MCERFLKPAILSVIGFPIFGAEKFQKHDIKLSLSKNSKNVNSPRPTSTLLKEFNVIVCIARANANNDM